MYEDFLLLEWAITKLAERWKASTRLPEKCCSGHAVEIKARRMAARVCRFPERKENRKGDPKHLSVLHLSANTSIHTSW
jgi:hypothetical protein